MREKSSSLSRHKRRHRSRSSSSDTTKPSHELSDLENNPSKYDRKQVKRRYSPKEAYSRSSDSSDDDNEKSVDKKRKKHAHHKKKDIRHSDSEDDHSKGKTSYSQRTGDKYKSKSEEQEYNKNRERDRGEYKYTKHYQKDQDNRIPSGYRTTDQYRRNDRHRNDSEDDGTRRDVGSSRQAERGMDSSGHEKRMQNNNRSQESRDNGNSRRKRAGENIRRDDSRGYQGRGERKNRWSDGGEGSRGGGGRRHRYAEEDEQGVSFDQDRPIKQEPDLNNDESENYEWGRKAADGSKPGNKKEKDQSKEKPNFGLSGKLTEDTNTVNGVVIKYSEPPEARKPRRRWRLYVFKGEENLPTLYLHRQSCFLIGRDRKVVDIPVDHPSCSKQHAAFQFRLVPYERVNGTMGKRVRPYIIDLESANGTFVNNNRIDSKKYVELLERDVMKFGFSSREYVLLHEQSKESDAEDDDVVGT